MKNFLTALAMLVAVNLGFAITNDDLGKDFTMVNNTNIASTVKLLTGMFDGYCATEIPFGSDAFTSPHSSKSFDWRTIKLICSNKFPCQAEIYVGDSVSCQTGQGDVAIGTALLNDDGSVQLLKMTSADYDIQVSGSTVTLSHK